MTGCGTGPLEAEAGNQTSGFSNTIVMQMDSAVQEVWDSARKINCEWASLVEKQVKFEPFEVRMLDFEEVRFEGDKVECFMDLLAGRYPDAGEITEAVSIGQPLSLVIYTRDDNEMYDINVKECFAYSSENYESSETAKLQLTDQQGCVMRNKLLEGFYTTREQLDDGGSKLVAFGHLSAFKFPDVLDVFTTCEVQFCKGTCPDKCPTAPIFVGNTPLDEPETTTETFFEGVELFGGPLSCNDPNTARVDPRCRPREPKVLEDELNCENDPFNDECPPDCLRQTEDVRCLPDCTLDPLHELCPPNCENFSVEDPRCPIDCNKNPTHPRCPADCKRFTGMDERCPCSERPIHPNCPPDCRKFGDKDSRCPPDCSKTPLDPRCPANCQLYSGLDPRCPCVENPFSKNCPPDCVRFAAEDPRCKPDCEVEPFHPQCPADCEAYTGSDPRCPCALNPRHLACPPDCIRDPGDIRCPPDCLNDPTNVRCPRDCKNYAGIDARCPCSKYPLNRNCPPNCEKYQGKDPRCPPDCITTPLHDGCPLDCISHPEDPRCPDFCRENPFDPACEGIELFGQPGATSTTTSTTTTTAAPTTRSTSTTTTAPAPVSSTTKKTTAKPKKATKKPRQGRNQKEDQDHHHHHHHDDHHGHGGGDLRFHPFHSFHYDPGDGRRGRGRRLGRRSIATSSIDFEDQTTGGSINSVSNGRARLARHIQVIDSTATEFDRSNQNSAANHEDIVCVSQTAFFVALVLIIALVMVMLMFLSYYCIKDRNSSSNVKLGYAINALHK